MTKAEGRDGTAWAAARAAAEVRRRRRTGGGTDGTPTAFASEGPKDVEGGGAALDEQLLEIIGRWGRDAGLNGP